jgi:hypothetical protein
MYEVIFVRNGAKAFVKKSTSFPQRKIRETGFYEIFYSHSSTARGSIPSQLLFSKLQYILHILYIVHGGKLK